MQSIPDHSTIFGFEADFAGALYCVPMCVRLKLDCAGVKVSLAQWNRLPIGVRDELVEMPCDDAVSMRVYRETVVNALEKAGESAKSLAIEPRPEWMAEEQIPAQLALHYQGLGLPALSVAQWQGLTPLQRFTLIKLSPAGHTNDNFLPALREFGLAPD